MDVIAKVADLGDDGDSGYVQVDGIDISWDMIKQGEAVVIDRRQRLAAAALLLAFDLPQNLRAAGKSMLEAAHICPGMTTGDLEAMGSQGKASHLRAARDLIEEMLREIE